MKLFLFIFRSIRHYWVSLLLNLIGLSIAFSIFFVLFNQVQFEWNYDGFYKDSDRIYVLASKDTVNNDYTASFQVPFILHVGSNAPHIEAYTFQYAQFWGAALPDDEPGTALSVLFSYVTADFPKVFDFKMVEGRDTCIATPGTALIPLSLAKKMFGEGGDYVGRKFGDNTSWYLVVGGVYEDFPKNSLLASNPVIQLPSPNIKERCEKDHSEISYRAYFKLDDPKNVDFFLQTGLQNRDGSINLKDLGLELILLKDIYFNKKVRGWNHGDLTTTGLLVAIALLIVVIASVNFINFSTAVIPRRIKGINTQKVLGASNTFLRFSLILESVFISMVAFLLSLLWIHYLTHSEMFSQFLSGDLSFAQNIPLLLVTGLLALAVGVLCSLYPSFYITSFPPALVLKGSFALSPKGVFMRNLMIGVQFFISFVSITMILFINLQNRYMYSIDQGFNKEEIVHIGLTHALRTQHFNALKDKLKSNPYIVDIATAESELGSRDDYMGWGRRTEDGKFINITSMPVSYNYLDVMEIEVTEGRRFREEDANAEEGHFIINETARKQYDLKVGNKIGSEGTIIGIIPDIHFASMRRETRPMAFYVWSKDLPWGIRDYTAAIRVKKGAPIYQVVDFIEKTCAELDSDAEANEARLYDQILQNLYAKERSHSTLISVFGLLSIFITITGIFGLLLFETQARRKEIGIRKVFGASSTSILIMFNKFYLRTLLVAFVISIPIIYVVADQWLQSFVRHIPIYWWVFVVAFLIVSFIVILVVTLRILQTARASTIHAIEH